MFGSVNADLFTGDITRLAVTNKTSDWFLTGNWQTEARFITVADSPKLSMSLDGYHASFTTAYASLGLPSHLVWNLIRELEFEDIMFMPPSIPCERREELPDLTINLSGHNFTLTPYDYTYEWEGEDGDVRCVGAFQPIPPEMEAGKEVLIGTAFLRAFYSVFDLGSLTVGCKLARRKKGRKSSRFAMH